MRYLCVCNGGHVRSVTLVRLLHKRGFEALSCGIDKEYKDETLMMLFNWADKIFFQRDSYIKFTTRIRKLTMGSEYYGTGYLDKVDFRYDVGPDDWKKPQEDSLLMKLRELVDMYPPDQEIPSVFTRLEVKV